MVEVSVRLGTDSSKISIPRSPENIQRVIQYQWWTITQQPTIPSGVLQELSGKVGRAHDYGSRNPLVFPEWPGFNSVQGWIHAAEIRQPDLLSGMVALIPAQRQQALTPIQVA